MEHRSVVRHALSFVILTEARVVVGEQGLGADRHALFDLLLTLRNAIVSDGVVMIIDRPHAETALLIELATAAGFSRIEATAMHVALRR